MGLFDNPIFWLVLLVVLLGIEVMTLGLTTIWFAGGALAAFLAALCGGTITLQIVLFLCVSVILLIFTRPVAVRHLNGKTTATNVDSLIGTQAVVTKEINNIMGQGEILVNGMSWSARAEQEEKIIKEGTIVEIVRITGVKAIVCETGKKEV